MQSCRTALLLLCLTTAGLAARAESSTPCRYEKGLVWVDVNVNNSREPLTFLLDSGAEESVIDQRAAKKLGLRFASREVVQAVGGKVTAFRTENAALQFAGVTIRKPLLAMNLRSASKTVGRTIDGLLGADFFTNRIVQIDYRAGQVCLLNKSPRSATSLPIVTNYDAMCVAVDVDGNRLNRVRLDTGCDQALRWAMRADSKTTANRRTIGLSSGNTRERRCALQMGGLALGEFKTSLHSRPVFPGEDGLLGNEALAKHVVTIDMVNRRLHLSPYR